jgi:AraC-like DNA-binding protein
VSAAHSIIPAFRHAVHHLHDPDEFGIAVSGASLTADFLAPQRLPARVEQFQNPAWAFDFHEAHVKARVRGPLPPGWMTLGLMRAATDSAFHGLATGLGVLVCNPPGEAIDGHIAPGFKCLAVSVPVEVWEQCRLLAGIERSAFGDVAAFHLQPTFYAAIEHQLRALRNLLLTSGSTPDLIAFAARRAADFAQQVATTAWELSSTAPPPRDSLRNRTRLARRAEMWMHEHLADAIQVPDVCLALRVSRRELEYAFRATFDQSPRDFLHALRLNAIRRALRRTGDHTSVLEVALNHGITHPSRFAAQYRQFFHENPSETRNKSLAA